ncbi:SMP-30/gluconolactonase/LRE family protein [Arcticibacter tournemirensis]
MRIILDQLNFPEGPCFDRTGNIWLVEKEAGNIVMIGNYHFQRFNVGGAPNGIAIGKDNLIWFCDSAQNSIRTFDPVSAHTLTVVNKIEDQALKMPNDLAFDKYSNLLFTCPGDSLDDNEGYICCLSPENTLSKISGGLYYPNGLAFNIEHSRLYIAETGTQKIWQFDWNAGERKLSKQSLFAETGGPVGPDGIAIDEDGYLYAAIYGSGKIKIWNRSGTRQKSIDTIGKNPTNCAIDPSGKKGIIITEAEKGILVQHPLTKKGIV